MSISPNSIAIKQLHSNQLSILKCTVLYYPLLSSKTWHDVIYLNIASDDTWVNHGPWRDVIYLNRVSDNTFYICKSLGIMSVPTMTFSFGSWDSPSGPVGNSTTILPLR